MAELGSYHFSLVTAAFFRILATAVAVAAASSSSHSASFVIATAATAGGTDGRGGVSVRL